MALKGEYNYIDTGLERTRMQFYFADVTAANFDATFGVAGKLNGVRTALNAVTLLNEVTVQGTVVAHSAAATSPNNALAQREYGVRLYMVDNVKGKVSHTFIPGIPAALLPASGDLIDLTVSEWAALKNQIESSCVSADGNAITVTKGVVTGRRN